MSFRVVALSLALGASMALSFSLQAQVNNGPGEMIANIGPSEPGTDTGAVQSTLGSITGTVFTSDRHAAMDARIEVHNLATGAVAGSGYVNPGGTFSLRGLPRGYYEVVATSGISEAREQVQVDGVQTSVNLTLPHSNTNDPSGGKTVSVSQLRVPEKARKELAKAKEALKKGDKAEARKRIDKALEIEPQYADAIVLRGVLALDENRIDAALEEFHQALQYDPSSAMAYIGTGAIYNMQGKFDDALRELDRGIALDPTSWQAQFEIAKANLGKGDFEAALQHANKAEGLVPVEFSPIHLLKGHALLGMKDYNSAVSQFEAFLSRDAGSPDAASAREELQQAKGFVTTANARK